MGRRSSAGCRGPSDLARTLPLRDWFADWSESTDPAIPPALLLAGRDGECAAAWDALRGPRVEHEVGAATRDEATAFIAAVLLADPPPDDSNQSPPKQTSA